MFWFALEADLMGLWFVDHSVDFFFHVMAVAVDQSLFDSVNFFSRFFDVRGEFEGDWAKGA